MNLGVQKIRGEDRERTMQVRNSIFLFEKIYQLRHMLYAMDVHKVRYALSFGQ
jgi:hypothetical protein